MNNRTEKGIRYEGGYGFSFSTAIKILGAENNIAGVFAEYDYIREKFGVEEFDWFKEGQELVLFNGILHDVLTIGLKDRKTRIDLYFDVSDFFGKHPLISLLFPHLNSKKIKQMFAGNEYKKGERVNLAGIIRK